MRACAKIGGVIIWSVLDNAEDCLVVTVSNDIIFSFVYLVYLSQNATNTDTNCQLTFSKMYLLLITCKITFWKYTRESMHLSMHEKCTIFAMKARNIQFTIVSLSTMRRECISRITSSSLIIRTCSCYQIRHFYIFLYIVSNVLLYSFIAIFHVCE